MKTIKHTVQEAKRLNMEKGFHFFEPATMRFFNSRVRSEILKGKYFITAEYMEAGTPTRYTVREVNWETGDIHTAEHTTFQQFESVQAAKDWVTESER